MIAVDGGGTVCLEAGVTPDDLVGDLDSAEPATVDELLSRGVPSTASQPRRTRPTWSWLSPKRGDRAPREIVVTAATAGRLDHTLAVVAALAAAADLQPQISDPEVAGWLLAPSGRRDLTLKGVGSTVSLMAWGGTALVSARGVRWPLERAELGPESTLGVSNRLCSTSGATFSAHQGAVLVLSVRGEAPLAVMVG